MATIENVNELIAVWNSVFQADDPIQALEAQGFTLAPGLKQKVIAANSQANNPSSEQRAELLKRLRSLGGDNLSDRVSFRIRPRLPVFITKGLPPGEYDLIIGIKLDVVNQALAGLYETHNWPSIIKPNKAGQLIKLDELRAFSDDIPTTEGLEVGALRFPSPPTASFAARDSLLVSQSFTLDLDQIQPSFPRRRTISTLVGTFRWDLEMNAAPNGAEPPRLVISFLPFLPSSASGQLEIDPGSLIQPRNAAALQALKDAISERIIGLLRMKSVVISPEFTLPVGEGARFQVQRVDVVAARTFDDVGALMLGVLIGPTSEVDPASGSTSQLQIPPFASGLTNLYVRFHEALANKLAQAAVESGLLDERVPDDLRKFGITLKFDSLSVDLKSPNKLGVKARVKLVDFCGPGPFNFKDLHVDISSDLQLAPGLNGEIRIVPGPVDIDFDDSDQAICAISGLVDLLTVVFSVDVIGELIVVALAKIIGPDKLADKLDFQFQAIIDPKQIIPFTELAPRGEIVQATVRKDALEALGSLTLNPDDDHTFVYLNVRTQPVAGNPSQPVAEAAVQVIDQDMPAPENDDPVRPMSTTTVQGTIITKVQISFKPPDRNELLAEGSTDEDGRVFLVINRLSTAGTITTKTIVEDTAEDSGVRITTEESPLRETRPDIFFRVRLPGEDKARDTRPSRDDLFFQPNLNSRRLGEPDAPLTLVFGRRFDQEIDGNVGGVTS